MPTMYLCDGLTNVIVMERLVASSTVKVVIDQLLARGEEGQQELRSLAANMGATVARMHRAGLIHGDITTSNILVRSEDSSLVMIDFGLSYQV